MKPKCDVRALRETLKPYCPICQHQLVDGCDLEQCQECDTKACPDCFSERKKLCVDCANGQDGGRAP